MERDHALYYRAGYKYQVSRDYHAKTSLIPFVPVDLEHLSLDMHGNMVIKSGYAWNGASGPTWDTKNSMIGSLLHDVGYQLIRLGYLSTSYKEKVDQLLHDCCTEDGMWSWRADYWRWAVLTFGMESCRPSAEPAEEVAP